MFNYMTVMLYSPCSLEFKRYLCLIIMIRRTMSNDINCNWLQLGDNWFEMLKCELNMLPNKDISELF